MAPADSDLPDSEVDTYKSAGGQRAWSLSDAIELAKKIQSERDRDQERPIDKSKIGNIPTEIQLLIFSYLPEGNSACLGLTCKKLYAIHHDNYPKTHSRARCEDSIGRSGHLRSYLIGFMGYSWCRRQLLAHMAALQQELIDMGLQCSY
ncbi:uncharacterized protein LY89DRAFT_774721 [Mollisia scopiformis]|uniref:F-box domain-containing protein n=1 Tax=Mollisia scopiformis TaxID=149040 RepID=A0A194XEX6_MOLSC|nr:uncharacterized protein LY89DRAFT_774721 [Mollisia scopiformis]KUJ18689.1 hypothetical protein LY89DRAFT_774721 [Mollisia scopiformis]